jgi:succinate dehydrogenase/fumarate reductase flavoprotein subunit
MMWDYDVDVVVIGYGGAGAATAITAHDAGAKVLILEKNSYGGGSTKVSGGSLRTYVDVHDAVKFIEILCEGATDQDIIRTFVEESAKNAAWITELGGKIVPTPAAVGQGFPRTLPGAAFPSIPGAEGIGPRLRVTGATELYGLELWKVLSKNVESRNVPVVFSTPARRLIREKSGEICGVAAAENEKEICARAKRAVVLASGGYEYDPALHLNYLGQHYCALGDPACTGDGIRMAVDVGADLWHMNAVAACFGYKFPDFEFSIIHWMPHPAYIYVDQTGRRFMDEPATDMHAIWTHTSYLDPKTLDRPRLPSYVLFDESTRRHGPVASTNRGNIRDVYQWSGDNMAEIRRGWVIASSTIEGLAAKIKIDPDRLRATLAEYNSMCAEGADGAFGRPVDTLVAIKEPPFYAIPMWPSLFNTQGGPRRNARAQVVDVWGNPIKRLYSAGELGSLWNRNYPGGGNITEALAFGRIAGKHAAGEPPLS